MGSEAACTVRYNGQASTGKALLETKELLFRGDFRLKIAFSDIRSLSDEDGELIVGFGEERAVFELGRNAAVWAQKIRNPRSRLDKLGVKTGQRVAVLGIRDADFLSELRDCLETVAETPHQADLVFYAADTLDDLNRLPELRDAIVPKGAIWVVSLKGKGAPVKDTDVMDAARAAGLVDTKVVAFSDTHTSLKLVIPVAKR